MTKLDSSASLLSGLGRRIVNGVAWLATQVLRPVGSADQLKDLDMIARGEPVSQDLIEMSARTIRTLVAIPGEMPAIQMKESLDLARVALENRYACLPLLRDAIESNREIALASQEQYESRRVTQLRFLPPYARLMCLQECQDQFNKVKVTVDTGSANTANLLHYARRFTTEHISRDKLLDHSHFAGSVSYAAGTKLLRALEPVEYDKHFSVTTKGSEVLVHDRFSPASHGPLGKAAAAAWEKMLKIALAAMIVEDLLPPLPTEISDQVKRETIERALSKLSGSPWDVANSVLIRNARLVHELLEAGEISSEVAGLVLQDSKALLRNDLAGKIDDIQHALLSRRERRDRQVERSIKSDDTTTLARERSSGEDTVIQAGNPKWEFYRAIHCARPELPFDKAFREKFSELYRIYRTSNISLQECIEIVRNDAAIPDQYIGSFAAVAGSFGGEASRVNYVPTVDSAPSIAAHQPADGDLIEPCTIEGADKEWFAKWQGTLDPISRRIVERRLERAKQGNFGDWRKLSAVQGHYELRIHYGEGQRIYYKHTGLNSIEIVAAGSKGEQDKILAQLR
jgi:putative addiction module killer protein